MQSSFKIMTELTCDLPLEYIKKNDLVTIPLTFTVDGVDYDGTPENSIDMKEFYDKLRQGSVSQTAQIPPTVASEFFEEQLKQGNDILFIGFSSGLSGTYQSILMAKAELKEKYPNQKIITIDSLCASLGQGLLIDFAVKQKNLGKTIDEVAVEVSSMVLHVCHYFTVDDLLYLHRGGRVSKATAIIGSILGIKPVMHVNNEGKLVPYGKVRGRRQSLDALVDRMKDKLYEYKNDYVFISHGDCEKDAMYVSAQVKAKYGIKTQIVNNVGAVIGTHSGPGTVALFYFGINRDEKAM